MTEQISEDRAKYCNNQDCPHRDICLWASEWRPEYPVFFGDANDCSEFVENGKNKTRCLCGLVNPAETEHWAEEYECAMMFLDSKNVPKQDENATFSIVGRINWIFENFVEKAKND